MSELFADTSFFVALVNDRDKHHADAIALSANSLLVATTDYVVIEVGNYFCRPRDRPLFLAVLRTISTAPTVHVVEASPDLQRRGVELFAARLDKSWSLTDCISFVVMEERGIADALTADRHFEQAGFKALLA